MSSTKDLPILMCAEMVRATIRAVDPKTMTRRLLMMPVCGGKKIPVPLDDDREWIERVCGPTRFQVGRFMWVRETFARFGERIVYAADHPAGYWCGEKWTPSIHMPREASRLTLRITGHRVERLHAITAADVRAEGVRLPVDAIGRPLLQVPPVYEPPGGWRSSDVAIDDYWIAAFAQLWDSLNGDRAPWSSNPWIEAVTFERTT